MLGKTVGGVFTLRVVLGPVAGNLPIDDVRTRPDSRVRLGGAAARCLENSG